jgi:hypothetical protein
MRYNNDLLGDKHLKNCWYFKWYNVMWILSSLDN